MTAPRGARRSRPPAGTPRTVRAAVTAALLLVVLLAAGCSVRVVDAGDTPTPDGHGTPTSPSDDVPVGASDDAAPVDADDLLDRAALESAVTSAGACGADVVVESAGSDAVYTGDCGTLTVRGAGARVVAGHVDHLVVEGGGAQVVVASVDRVTIDAAAVRVAWEDGDPQVTSSGADVAYGPVGTVRLASG